MLSGYITDHTYILCSNFRTAFALYYQACFWFNQTPSMLTVTSLDIFVGIAYSGWFECYGEDFENIKDVFG